MTPEYLEELADIADPGQLWRLPGLEQVDLPADKRRQLDAGVALRRHASHISQLRELLQCERSLLITPLSDNSSAVMAIDTPPQHQKLREARKAAFGAQVPAKLVTHCPWCAAPVSVAEEPYCANADCRWNNGGTAPAGVNGTEAASRDGVLREAKDAIDRYIVPGRLSGNGFDKTAERNGIILASNILAQLLDAPRSPRWPAGLLDRIKAAEKRIEDDACPRRIPADPNGDVDLVLAEVRYLIEGRWPPFWIKDAAGAGAVSKPLPYDRAAVETLAQRYELSGPAGTLHPFAREVLAAHGVPACDGGKQHG